MEGLRKIKRELWTEASHEEREKLARFLSCLGGSLILAFLVGFGVGVLAYKLTG